MAAPSKLGKDVLLDIIEEGYKAGIGPAKIAAITGYSDRTIRRYSEGMGLTFGQGAHSTIPDPLPVPFLIALAKAGIARDTSVI